MQYTNHYFNSESLELVLEDDEGFSFHITSLRQIRKLEWAYIVDILTEQPEKDMILGLMEIFKSELFGFELEDTLDLFFGKRGEK